MQNKTPGIWSIWKGQKDRLAILLFGLVAMPGVQYTFFATIKASNIATATLLQYLAPVMIFLFLAFSKRKKSGILQTLAIAYAFYTLYPVDLLKRWGSTLIVGWGMIIGGIELSFFFPPWHMEGQIWDGSTVFFVAFIILPGTLIPFYLFMESLHHNTPTESSLLANIEPLTAAIVSAIWLQAPMGFFEILGGLCIIGTVTLLTFQSDKKHDMSG